jgi:hypothetical protein
VRFLADRKGEGVVEDVDETLNDEAFAEPEKTTGVGLTKFSTLEFVCVMLKAFLYEVTPLKLLLSFM